MARYDKLEPHVGNFRAKLAAATLAGDVGFVRGVSLNASGQIVIGGSGQTGIVGVMVADKEYPANKQMDVLTNGEVVDLTGLAAGTVYYINATTGVLETAAPAAGANKWRAGHTVEADRLVVRCQQVQG